MFHCHQGQSRPLCVPPARKTLVRPGKLRTETAVTTPIHSAPAPHETATSTRGLLSFDYLSNPADLQKLVAKTYAEVRTLASSTTLPPEQIHQQQEFVVRHLMPLLAFLGQYHPDRHWRVQAHATQEALGQLAELLEQ